MAVVTKFRLAEEILKWLSGSNIPAASNTSLNEIKIAIGQVCNSLLKVDYFQTNTSLRETIPNGTMIGLYEDIPVTKWKNRSQATIPIKPVKLPRNMGVWSISPSDDPTNEFIPLQMGQLNLLQSQPMLNDLLGQVGYEVYSDKALFTKDITIPNETVSVNMRLIIMDIDKYDDYDILPILPEMEWQVKNEVIKLYGGQPMPDKTVDPSVQNQRNVPINQQTEQ